VKESRPSRRFRHPPGGDARDIEREIAEACADFESVDSIRGRTRLLNLLRDDSRRRNPAFEAWRTRARRLKEASIDQLPRLLERVQGALRSRGQSLYLAGDAADANRYITRLCRRRGIRTAVKSKSMTSEEIELNDALRAAGVEPVETDLGEYLAQLTGERPSHIIGPVIHKSRREIIEAFREHVNRDLPDDVTTESLTGLAREVLRERFLDADLGVTGANFVVAESGSIALVTNEGNARWTMEAPPVHVAVAGVEKLIPTLEDLQPFYELLPKSGTGQPVTSYFSLVTPPPPDPRLPGVADAAGVRFAAVDVPPPAAVRWPAIPPCERPSTAFAAEPASTPAPTTRSWGGTSTAAKRTPAASATPGRRG